MYIVLFPSF